MCRWKKPCSSVFFIIMTNGIKRKKKQNGNCVYEFCTQKSYAMQITSVPDDACFSTVSTKICTQILQEPSSITARLCYIPHEQILLRRWSRLHPNPALRQMFPHLWGSNSLNVRLPAVSGRWGRGVYEWLIFDIMQCLSIRSDYWNLPYILPLPKIVYVCMCVHAPILPEQYLAFTV